MALSCEFWGSGEDGGVGGEFEGGRADEEGVDGRGEITGGWDVSLHVYRWVRYGVWGFVLVLGGGTYCSRGLVGWILVVLAVCSTWSLGASEAAGESRLVWLVGRILAVRSISSSWTSEAACEGEPGGLVDRILVLLSSRSSSSLSNSESSVVGERDRLL